MGRRHWSWKHHSPPLVTLRQVVASHPVTLQYGDSPLQTCVHCTSSNMSRDRYPLMVTMLCWLTKLAKWDWRYFLSHSVCAITMSTRQIIGISSWQQSLWTLRLSPGCLCQKSIWWLESAPGMIFYPHCWIKVEIRIGREHSKSSVGIHQSCSTRSLYWLMTQVFSSTYWGSLW